MGETKLKRTIYDKSPVFLQNLIASVYGLEKNIYRFWSPRARYWQKFYSETKKWDEERLKAYQLEQVKHTIRYSYQNVPFYQKRFKAIGLVPEDIKTLDDLRKIPYLTKDEVRMHGNEIISKKYNAKRLFSHPTSGSTGMPMTLYNNREAALRNYAHRWINCRPGIKRNVDKCANFTGLELVKPSQSKPPFWRMNYASRQRLYSIFHMSDTTLPAYLEDMEKFKPAWLYGYPSAIYTLAEFIMRTGYDYRYPPKAIITSSEQCLPQYKKVIEKAFKTKHWDEYGQGEYAGLAFECECGSLHELLDYAFIEFIPTNEYRDNLEVHEMVCTSFINEAWPLIRYRVGDLALIDNNAKCFLGRPGRIIAEIYGRTANFLVAADGTKISNISVMAKKCRNVKSMQAVQKKLGQITLRVVKLPEFDTDEDEALIISEFRKKLGDESRLKIDIEYVNEIGLTKAGKFISIVSEL